MAEERTGELKQEGGDTTIFSQPLGEFVTGHVVELSHDRAIIMCEMTNGYVWRFQSRKNPDDRDRFFQMSLSPEGMQAVAFLYGIHGQHQRDTVAFWSALDPDDRKNLEGAIAETTEQYNNEQCDDLRVGIIRLLSAWAVNLSNDTEALAVALDAGQYVPVNIGAPQVEALVDFIKKHTFVGAPGQRIGDNLRLNVPLQEARDFAAFAECCCDIVEGRAPGDCLVCRIVDALYIATGEDCYKRDREGVEVTMTEREGFATISGAPAQQHPVVLYGGDEGVPNIARELVTANERAADVFAQSSEDVRPPIAWSDMTDGERIAHNKKVIAALLRNLQPGDHLTLNEPACAGAGFTRNGDLLSICEKYMLHADVRERVREGRVSVTFTKAEASETQLRFEVSFDEQKGGAK